MTENAYNMLAGRIIKQQEMVVGSLAWVEANKVSGISAKDHAVEIAGDGKKVLADLVAQYEKLFGQASIQVCRDALKPVATQIAEGLLPDVLAV